MALEARTISIVRLLCGSEELHMTAGEIAERLEVSAKTVSRELPKVEKFLSEYGLTLEKRAGSGLWLEGGSKGFAALQEFLAASPQEEEYTPEMRRSIIMSCLLPSEEPIKLFSLAARLKVTDSTISNDLDKLEPWFAEHALRLVRKPGLGVYIEGEEQDFRRAVIQYIYENMGEQELLDLLQKNFQTGELPQSGANRYLLDLVDGEIIQRLEKIVREQGESLGLHLSDNALVGLVVHLSLAVERIRKQDEISMDKSFLAELKENKEFAAASALGQAMAEAFDIEVPEDEIGYIAMHLLGARNRYREKTLGSVAVMDNYHLVKLAKGIMERAGEETGRDIGRNQGLLAGLVNHLGPSLSRMKMGMDIRNPLLSEMKSHYPELMAVSRRAVAEVEETLGRPLPEAEVAYIAMHLGAALSDSENFTHVVHRAVVACPTGMGTSRLLASRIRKQYPNIRLVDQASTLDIDEEYLQRLEAEFIISTVPIPHAPVPVVVVTPMLNQGDMERIQVRLQQQNKLFLKEAALGAVSRRDFREGLRELTECGETILTILEGFFFQEAEAKDIKEACHVAGQAAGRDEAAKTVIFQSLWEREKKAATLLTGNHLVLLHCRTPLVEKPRMGILHFGKGFLYPEENGEPVRTALVLLAPEHASKAVMETLGYISSVLLDRWGLMEVLHEGDRQHIERELSKMFKEFYRNKHRECMDSTL